MGQMDDRPTARLALFEAVGLCHTSQPPASLGEEGGVESK